MKDEKPLKSVQNNELQFMLFYFQLLMSSKGKH